MDQFEAALVDMLETDTAKPAPEKKPKKPRHAVPSTSVDVYKTVEGAIAKDKGAATTMRSVEATLAAFVDKQPDDVVRYELIATKPGARVVLLRTLSSPNSKIQKQLQKLTGAEQPFKLDKEKKNDSDFIAIVRRSSSKPKKKLAVDKKKKEKKPKAAEESRERIKSNIAKLKKKTAAVAVQPAAAV